MAQNPSLPPNTPLLEFDKNGQITGRIANEWYRYLLSINRTANSAGNGVVSTASGSGLAGGGTVSDGVALQIADNGVSNTMLRQSAGTSVIGRAFNSTGNVADITAIGDNRVLTRQGGSLAFRQNIEATTVGLATPAAVRCTTLRIDTAPIAATPTATFTVEVNLNGSVYKLLATT